jgi:hypothetical protein
VAESGRYGDRSLEFHHEKAVENVRELFRTIIATSGIMLALLWGLTQRFGVTEKLVVPRIASGLLVLSILASLLGWQFIVTKFEADVSAITKENSVAYSFLIASASFFLGVLLILGWALFTVNSNQGSTC